MQEIEERHNAFRFGWKLNQYEQHKLDFLGLQRHAVERRHHPSSVGTKHYVHCVAIIILPRISTCFLP